jgi:hypothetical protein
VVAAGPHRQSRRGRRSPAEGATMSITRGRTVFRAICAGAVLVGLTSVGGPTYAATPPQPAPQSPRGGPPAGLRAALNEAVAAGNPAVVAYAGLVSSSGGSPPGSPTGPPAGRRSRGTIGGSSATPSRSSPPCCCNWSVSTGWVSTTRWTGGCRASSAETATTEVPSPSGSFSTTPAGSTTPTWAVSARVR